MTSNIQIFVYLCSRLSNNRKKYDNEKILFLSHPPAFGRMECRCHN